MHWLYGNFRRIRTHRTPSPPGLSACQKSPITIDIVLLRMGGRLCPPGRLHRFYGNLRQIRNFQAGRCRHRPLQSRSFQASTDKMLCFQGMFSFRRKRPSFLNCCGTIENTGQTGFFGFTGDSSQIVVMQLPVAEKLFQE